MSNLQKFNIMELVERAKSNFLKNSSQFLWLTDNISYQMSDTYRTKAGSCAVYRNIDGTHKITIKLSTALFETMNEEARFQTVSHELAHAVAFNNKIPLGHCPKWKLIHRLMGGNGIRCHSETVNHNIVKREVVLLKYDNLTYNVAYCTSHKLGRVLNYYQNAIHHGTIALDKNKKTYRYVTNSKPMEITDLNIIGWHLVT